MSDACTALETPVTGGNVSLYNEHPEGAVFPTPTIGMLGIVDDVAAHSTTAALRDEGDVIFLLTPDAWTHRNEIGGSEYLATLHGMTTGDAPHIDLDEERAVQHAMLHLIREGVVAHAHDVSDGGLAVALAEAAVAGRTGAEVDLGTVGNVRADALLFGEAQSRITFSSAPEDADRVDDLAASLEGVAVRRIGTAGGPALRITTDAGTWIDAPVDALERTYESAIPDRMTS
jgi:phosphoribosylformylglycinamidine synthase